MENLVAYKYRSFNDKNNHREDFLANRLWFSALNQLNDPFEGILPIQNLEDASDDDIVETNIKIAQYHNPQLASNFETLEKYREMLYSGVPDIRKNKGGAEYRNYAQHIITQHIYNHFGVYCLSRTPINYLMWSHYADSHKGFCIGFDLVKLGNQMNEKDLKPGCFCVDYMVDRPVYTVNDFNRNNNDVYAQKYLATKGKLWDYEEELRIITMGLVNQYFSYDPNTICEIVLGWKTSKETETAIISHLKDNGINCSIYKVRPSEAKYEMEEERIY